MKLSVFNLVTLDGYIAGKDGDISWHAGAVDAEFTEYAERNSNSGSTLLFGRTTYDLMRGHWASAEALKNDPIVAKGMNASSKVVYSRTLTSADWGNTELVSADLLGDVRRRKVSSGKGLTVLGSGTIVAQLTEARLIDEYLMMVCPLALGEGKTMFEGMTDRVALELTDLRRFRGGSILLTYVPA